MNDVTDLLVEKIIGAGRATTGDCSGPTVDRIDFPQLTRALTDVMRSYRAGRIGEEEALLFARVHWALAALKAISVRGKAR
jgi:hypothetical protein